MEFVPQPVSTVDQPRRRRRGLLVLLLGLAVLTMGTGAFSLARFTSSDTSSGAFTTGTIVLDATPATLFTVTGMLPGDSGSATLNVKNDGTGELRYAMTSSSTNADGKGLMNALNLSITAGACPGSGSPLYASTLNGAAFGNAAQGPHSGDRVLASGASEDLCFAWSLPLLTGDGVQDATTTATFTFDAEQTANNP
jgi:hypothetical protein